MDNNIIAPIIALSGVLASIIFTLLWNKKVLKAEIEKFEGSIEQNYANRLSEKRMEFYPLLYEHLSDFGKLIKKSKYLFDGSLITNEILKEFIELYDKLNSKYSLFFSSHSSSASHNIIIYIYEYFKEKREQESIIQLEFIDELRNKLTKLEVSLKNDIGVYLVEFNDPKKKTLFKDYSDVLAERKRTEEKKKILKNDFLNYYFSALVP